MSFGLYGFYIVELAIVTAGLVLLFGSDFSGWLAVAGVLCWIAAVVWPVRYIFKLVASSRNPRNVRSGVVGSPSRQVGMAGVLGSLS